MDTLIGRLEKVCRLLKEDEVAQRSLALVLYGKVALIKYETCSGEAISAYSCQACDILNLSLHKSGFYSVNLIWFCLTLYFWKILKIQMWSWKTIYQTKSPNINSAISSESSVAAYNETETSKLSDASFSDSFEIINTSRVFLGRFIIKILNICFILSFKVSSVRAISKLHQTL